MWLSLIGCGAAGDSSAFSPTAADAVTVPDVAPVYTAGDVEQIVTDALADGVPSLAPIARAVTNLFDLGDAACPGEEYAVYGISVFDPVGCTATSGAWFEGAGAFVMGLGDADGDGRAETFDGELKMDMSGRDPGGFTLEVGGDSTIVATLGDLGPSSMSGMLAGTYRWTADPAWLGQGVSLALYYTVDGQAPERTITLDGGFTVTDAPSIGFEDVVLGGDCGAAPTGAVLTRDTVGHWYRLDFDPTTCDGCGPLTFNLSTDLGRACVDLIGPTDQMAADLEGWTVERMITMAEDTP